VLNVNFKKSGDLVQVEYFQIGGWM